MNYVTVFPECENVHLKKDVGMLPYSMGKYAGYDFQIVCYDNGNFTEKEIDFYHVRCIEKKRGVLVDFAIYIIQYAKKIDILNLYHITSDRNAYWCFLYKLFNPKGKIHIKLDADYRMLSIYNPYPKELKAKIRSYIFKYFIDLYTVETSEMLSKLQKGWNVDIKLLPNGIMLEDERVLGPREDLFLSVGRLGTEQKATEILLEAFSMIAKTTAWDLLLVGTIEEGFNEYIKEYFGKNPELERRITFTGNIDDKDELQKIYTKAKVFVLPSRWESFGLVLLEALGRGEYIIVSDKVESVKDICCNEKYYDTFPCDNSIELGKAMLKATEREVDEKVQEEGFLWVVDNFSWKKIAQKLDRLLKSAK